ERLGQLGAAVLGIMSSFSEAEMEIVFAQLQGVGHLNILQRPTAEDHFQILGSILQPDADVVFFLFANFEGILMATLDIAVASDPREHAAKLIRLPPGYIERANRTRRKAAYPTAVTIAADVVI